MTYIKKYGIGVLYSMVGMILFLGVITLLYYFNLIGNQTYQILKLVVLLCNIFVGGFIVGRNSSRLGYLEGIKFGCLLLFMVLIPTIIFSKFRIRLFIYYLTILGTSVLGGMVGISKKKKLD